MKTEHGLISLPRSTSYRNNRRVLPSSHHHSRSSPYLIEDFSKTDSNKPFPLRGPDSPSSSSTLFFPRFPTKLRPAAGFSSLLRSLLTSVSGTATRWLGIPAAAARLALTPSLGRKLTGTLFGHRRGHVTFAVQHDPRSEPALLLELATSTSALVKEMASGLVRIALECEKGHPAVTAERERGRVPRLFDEPRWTMYCNGRRCGYALSRACGDADRHVLSKVQSVSVGAGVIPAEEAGDKGGGGGEGEVLYMRARFERVVGSRDSEAFYMMNPDGSSGGPELSIFLLRV